MATTFILGGAQSDFARNLGREGLGLRRARRRARRSGQPSPTPRWSPPRSAVIHVGNAFGELFTGQGHLGAMPATVRPTLWGVPASRHEAACASGSIPPCSPRWRTSKPVATTRRSVLGVEQQRNVPRRASGAAARSGGVGRTRGRDGALPVAAHVLADRRCLRRALGPRSPTPGGGRTQEPRERAREPAGADPVVDDQRRDVRRGRRDQPGRRGQDPPRRLRAADRRRRCDRPGVAAVSGGVGEPAPSRPRAYQGELVGWGHRTAGIAARRRQAVPQRCRRVARAARRRRDRRCAPSAPA